jgi:hypothetical protein
MKANSITTDPNNFQKDKRSAMLQEELGTLQFNYLVLTQKVISNSSSPTAQQNAGEPVQDD